MFLDWERTIKILGVESNFEVALVPVELSAVSTLEYSNLLEWHKEADWYGQTIALQYRDDLPASR